MTAPDAFGPIISRWHIAEGMKDDIERWMPEYLAAYARQYPDPPGAPAVIAPQSYTVRHAARMRAGEQLPAVVVWIAGVTNQQQDPEGQRWGDLELGVFLVAGSNEIAATGDLLHRHVAAVTALLMDRDTCNGLAQSLDPLDEDFTPIEPERERTLLGADLRYLARGVLLGIRGQGPPPGSDPREDPSDPWPPAPTALTADVVITPRPIDPED